MNKEYIIRIVPVASGAIAVIAIVLLVYFFQAYQKSQRLLHNPAEAAALEIAALVGDIGRFMELPVDEQPTLATVSDRDKLKDQPFFQKSANGDKVLIYSKALLMILYRPSTKKVIEETVFTSPGQANVTNTPATVVSKDIRIALRNGTTKANLTSIYEKELKTKLPDVVIEDHESAKRSDYAYSMIIDVSGSHKAQTAQLATLLGIAVGELPIYESTPPADFLIIVGADKK